MGIYLQVKGGNYNKAAQLLAQYESARRSSGPQRPGSVREMGVVPVCVVKNAAFEAALVIGDDHEFKTVTQDPSDMRPREWLLMSLDDVLANLREFGATESQLVFYGLIDEEPA